MESEIWAISPPPVLKIIGKSDLENSFINGRFPKSKEAILNLKKSRLINSENAYAWYLLSRAYAQTGSITLANYATAERYFLIGERELSYEFAVKALKQIEENSPEWYRSNDLIRILQKEVSKRWWLEV